MMMRIVCAALFFSLLIPVFFTSGSGDEFRWRPWEGLFSKLQTVTNDTARVHILNELCWHLRTHNPDTALHFGKSALLLGKELLSSATTGKQAIWLKKSIANSHNHIGVVYDLMGKYELALRYYLKAVPVYEETGDTAGLAASLNNVGIIYYSLNETGKALKYYKQALEYRKKMNDLQGIAGSMNNIGLVHLANGIASKNPGDFDLAIDHFLSALLINDSIVLSTDEKASLDAQQSAARCLGNIAIAYKQKGELTGNAGFFLRAVDYNRRALDRFESSANKKGMVICLIELGDISRLQGRTDEAVGYLEQCLGLAKEIGPFPEIAEIYNTLSITCEEGHRIAEALRYARLHTAARDSALNEEKNNQIIEMRTRYESEKQAEEITLLQKENELKSVHAKRQQIILYFLIAGIAFTLVIALLVIRIYLGKKKAAKELEKLSLVASRTDNYVIITDRYDHIEWVNEGFTKITGYRLDEVNGKRPQDFLRGEQTDALTGNRIESQRESHKPFSEEILNYRKDGEPLWLTLHVNPILDRRGEVVHYINIGNDISRRKQSEAELANAYEEIREKNRQITDGLEYARTLQQSILPGEEQWQHYFPDSFILFKPLEFVSGDFYWIHAKGVGSQQSSVGNKENKLFDTGSQLPTAPSTRGGLPTVIFAVCDCTGHGVPGAMIHMVANNLLSRIIHEKKQIDAGEILTRLHRGLITALSREENPDQLHDGMEVALCTLPSKWNENTKNPVILQYACAGRSIFVVENGTVSVLSGNRNALGAFTNQEYHFSGRTATLNPGSALYLFTDGYVNQLGGIPQKKFSIKRFKQLLQEISHKPMAEQKNILEDTFYNWKGKEEITDDVLVVGIRV